LTNESNNINDSNQSNDRNKNNISRNINIRQKSQETNINVLPSQKNMLKKESLILSIETKLYTIQQEKDKVNSKIF